VSAWILGSEIADSLGLRDFEFAHEYVAKGLAPHNKEGQPYMPAAVVEQFIQGLEQELNQHDELAWDLGGIEREEIIAKYIDPLHKRIQGLLLYRDSFNGSGWQDLELPADQDLSRHFLRVLLNSYYRREEVYGRPLPESEPRLDQEPARPDKVADQVQVAVKGRKLTQEQRHKIDSRAAAMKIWSESPEITIQDMIQRDEIANACEGVVYGEKTIRNWIKDLAPNRKPGRPKKKHS